MIDTSFSKQGGEREHTARGINIGAPLSIPSETRGNEVGGKRAGRIERAGTSGEGSGDGETLTVQETAEGTVRERVYYDSPYVGIQVVGLALFCQLESHWLFPLQLGTAAAWDQLRQEGDFISYVWGSFESLETWTHLCKCKALLQEGFLWWSRTRKVNYWERLSGFLKPSGDFHPCRPAPILVPAFSTIPMHAVMHFCARLLSMMVFL